jgi:alanine dehydrogenase
MLFLSRRDVERLLDPDELIDALAPAMADLSAGRASMPPRNFAHVRGPGAGVQGPGSDGILAAMPAYVPASGALAAKLVLVFHGNAARGLETHQAIVAVFDPETGEPAAIMDGASITALRTAAGSALATRLCAREDAATLAIIGTGVQARSHARLIPRVRKITDVIVAGRTPAHVEAFATSIGARAAASYEEAVAGADIVCACTNATEPVIRRAWLKPGTHVNAVGFAPGPELEPDVFADASVVVESRASVIGTFPNGASDLTQAVEAGLLSRADLIEVGELVDGRQLARNGPDQITIYRSVGVAVQDAAAAMCVLRAARRANAGTEVSL